PLNVGLKTLPLLSQKAERFAASRSTCTDLVVRSEDCGPRGGTAVCGWEERGWRIAFGFESIDPRGEPAFERATNQVTIEIGFDFGRVDDRPRLGNEREADGR